MQQDASDHSRKIFQLYALKEEVPPASKSKADYAITKTALASPVTVGEVAGYLLNLTNNGPEDGAGVSLSDDMLAGIGMATWVCTTSGAATCASSGGVGNALGTTARIPVGASVTVRVEGRAAAAGILTNTATIVPLGDTEDPVLANNSSTASIEVRAAGGGGGGGTNVADLQLRKTTPTPTVKVNEPVQYTIEVYNAGPDKVDRAALQDVVPTAITDIHWQCSGSNGATCAAATGSGNHVETEASLPAGARVRLEIRGIAKTEGLHTNLASVTHGQRDPDSANNTDRAEIEVERAASGIGTLQGTLLTTGATAVDGDVYVWGFRGSSQQGNGVMVVSSSAAPAKVKSLSNIVALTGGAYHLIALDANGDVYGWGQSGYGETGCKPTQGIYVSTPCKVLSNATQIAAGEYFSVALGADGQVWTWGHNLYGQLGTGVHGTRYNTLVPQAVNLNGEKARLIGGAYESAFAVTAEGHVWAWGDNEASGLGFKGSNYGVQRIEHTPTHVTLLDAYADRITYIAGGNGWGEALLDDGTVIGWGLHAALGQGTTRTNLSAPEPVTVLTGVSQLYARYVGSVALTRDGQIYTWGQTGGSAFPMVYGASPTLRSNVHGPVIEVGGGKEHIFYKTEDGNTYGIGYNDLYKLDQSRCCAPIIDWPGKQVFLDKP
ncbi:hypothetical protein FACS1894116_11460 [Betaproteobacteria bacterium]|nr:hypothetical protein FACS1894116_11460 [Betaproteobacteria bacterium]